MKALQIAVVTSASLRIPVLVVEGSVVEILEKILELQFDGQRIFSWPVRVALVVTAQIVRKEYSSFVKAFHFDSAEDESI